MYLTDYVWEYASRISRNTLSSTFEVENGEPILVMGFQISGAIAAFGNLVTVKNGDNTILILPVGILQDHSVSIAFIADNGLSFTADGNGASISVTVFHMSPGE